jgi:hypothetical protein
MKILVTYWSQTGNTKKVAEAIFGAIPVAKAIQPMDKVDSLEGYDLAFIGFPVMQFGVPAAAKKFIQMHSRGKSIALFVTHAMPSDSQDPQQQSMLLKELDKCVSACFSAAIPRLFHCQGELSEKVSGELMASGIPMLMEFAAMRASTIGHPSAVELESAGVFAANVVETFQAANSQTEQD